MNPSTLKQTHIGNVYLVCLHIRPNDDRWEGIVNTAERRFHLQLLTE